MHHCQRVQKCNRTYAHATILHVWNKRPGSEYVVVVVASFIKYGGTNPEKGLNIHVVIYFCLLEDQGVTTHSPRQKMPKYPCGQVHTRRDALCVLPERRPLKRTRSSIAGQCSLEIARFLSCTVCLGHYVPEGTTCLTDFKAAGPADTKEETRTQPRPEIKDREQDRGGAATNSSANKTTPNPDAARRAGHSPTKDATNAADHLETRTAL